MIQGVSVLLKYENIAIGMLTSKLSTLQLHMHWFFLLNIRLINLVIM